MDKDVVQTCHGVLVSHGKEPNQVIVVIWTNRESVVQSEVNQKRNKCCALTHTYGMQENGAGEPSSSGGREMQTWRTDLWAQRGKGEGGMNGESGVDVYTPS